MNEWILRGGLICDGSGSAPFRGDVHLKDGKIAAIETTEIAAPTGVGVLPAQDFIIAPGLIDLHAHVYDGMNLHSVSPADIGLKTGVTTILDTGSAGAMNFGTFAKYVIPAAQENIFALLNISHFGVQGAPGIFPEIYDLHDIAHFDVAEALCCCREYSPLIVGVKVRLTAFLADHDPDKERAALRAVLQLRDESGLPLMVHHVMSSISLEELLPQMKAGDILTHFLHEKGDGGFKGKDGAPSDALLEARASGVIFDVGHGSGCFSWRVSQAACARHNFWPDTISSDLHIFNLQTPVVDMPTTMSKFLHLGMPLENVIRAATLRAADAMNQPQLGRLQVGLPADVSVLKIVEGRHALIDSEGEKQIASQRLVPVCVFKDGARSDCKVDYDNEEQS
jgi:dihydroorotase